MKVYKILHKPTGLFFTPSRGTGNFSINGKIYDKKPSLKWVEHGVRVLLQWSKGTSKREQALIKHFKIEPYSPIPAYKDQYNFDKTINVPLDEWEIIEL
jgi:hypothetical protein